MNHEEKMRIAEAVVEYRSAFVKPVRWRLRQRGLASTSVR
jgi:hypothetical protein